MPQVLSFLSLLFYSSIHFSCFIKQLWPNRYQRQRFIQSALQITFPIPNPPFSSIVVLVAHDLSICSFWQTSWHKRKYCHRHFFCNNVEVSFSYFCCLTLQNKMIPIIFCFIVMCQFEHSSPHWCLPLQNVCYWKSIILRKCKFRSSQQVE